MSSFKQSCSPPSLPPPSLPEISSVLKDREGSGPSQDHLRLSQVHDCPDHNAECPNMTSPLFFFLINIPASKTVDHLCFFLSRCRKSKDENDGSIRFFCPLSVLISVHCCHSCCHEIFIFIYIFLIYIFLQGIKQTHRHDEFIVSKHIKGEARRRKGGWEVGRGSPSRVVT